MNWLFQPNPADMDGELSRDTRACYFKNSKDALHPSQVLRASDKR